MKIRIFQKGFNFSQDGPGNRLIYHLQGCNLRCPWCSNPEGLEATGGTEYELEELTQEVLRSKLLFFDGGGVTLTGGEVTMQFDAVKEFLSILHANRIHTCIETNGISKRLPELFPMLDLLIMDIKHYDEETHRRVTGLSNQITICNICEALYAGQPLLLRIPLIGGVNASEEDAHRFASLFKELGIDETVNIELLSYHEYGKAKYQSMGLEYKMTEAAKVPQEKYKLFRDILKAEGFQVIKT